jgi:hypothetical protein
LADVKERAVQLYTREQPVSSFFGSYQHDLQLQKVEGEPRGPSRLLVLCALATIVSSEAYARAL